MLFALALVLFQTPASRPADSPVRKPAGGTGVAAIADKVVGIINNEVITQSEIDARLASVIATQGIKDPAVMARQREEEKIQLAYQLLLTQAAKKLAFDEKQIEDGVRKRVDEEEKRAGGRAALHRNIESQGKSVAEWEREQKNLELMERLLLAEIGYDYRPEKEIVITPTLLRNYYKEHLDDFKAGPMTRGRIISISDARARSRANAMQLAKELAQRIKKGEDFTNIAREHSEFRPQFGGEITWVERDRGGADPAVLEFLFTHEKGSVSEPLDVEGGVAIIKLEDKRPAGLRPFQDQETQEEIARRIYNAKRIELRTALIRRLRTEAYVWPPDLFEGR